MKTWKKILLTFFTTILAFVISFVLKSAYDFSIAFTLIPYFIVVFFIYNPKTSDSKVEDVLSEYNPNSPRNWTSYIVIFLLGFALYVNTVPFKYALDDKLYITANEFTKKGFDGFHDIWTNDLMTGFFGSKKNLVEGGRYRPLAQTTHAIEWELFGENPHISHFINVVLYGLTGVLLLSVLQRIFGRNEKRWWWSLAFVATALFLAHPTHTEVGANIKSRDEIMSLLFALFAFRSVLIFIEKDNKLELLLSGVWFFASLLSKESSVTFLGLIPLTLIFFPKGNFSKSILSLSSMAVFTVVYLAIRLTVFADQGNTLNVAEELMNKPYLLASPDERLASIFFTMGLYIKLLLFPHPLTHDYYPFHPFRTFEELSNGSAEYLNWSDKGAVISLALYVLLALFGLYTLVRKLSGKEANIYGYGILVYLGTFILFSNLFFDIGAFMNERFVYIPSLGFTIILAHVLVSVIGKKAGQNAAIALFAILMVGYSGKTIARNYAWESDRSLSAADIGTSDGSAKIRMTYSSELLERAKEKGTPEAERQRLLDEAEQMCLSSLKIYPKYFPPLDILGNIYFEKKNYGYSAYYFKQAVKYKPNDTRIRQNTEAVGNVALNAGDADAAIEAYSALAAVYKGKDLSRVYSGIGEAYGKIKQDVPSSKKYLQLAQQADPENSSVYQKLGIVYAMTGKADSALYNFNEALRLDPGNARVLMNLGVLYSQMGQTELGGKYLSEAYAKDPSLKGN